MQNPLPLQQVQPRASLDVVAFGPFTLSLAGRLLERDGAPVTLGGRAFDILAALVSDAGQVIEKRDLIARVWPNVVVDEGSLRVHMVSLRKALGDGEGGARYITNIPGRGYCWVAPLTRPATTEAASPPPPAPSSPPAGGPRLPPRLARMVGRDDAVRLLGEELLANRFVTVLGPGGIGKTTVALAVAHAMKPAFDGGTHFIDLAGLGDPQLVAGLIASSLGLQGPSGDALAPLLAYFEDRRAFLILDNCEHLIETVADLAERLWRDAPQVHILATSREPLRAEGEYVHRLPALPCPPDDLALGEAELLTFPAAQLFVERITASGRPPRLDTGDAATIASICRKLDGIALAIELAAGRVEAYGVAGIDALLDKRFNLLSHGRRTAVARQQTMSATIGWSYNLLDETERRTARRLAMFSGPFPLEGAQAVAADAPEDHPQIVACVADLVAKSLLSLDAQGAQTRYRFLETTRAYLLERLVEADERDAAALRHARFMTGHLRLATKGSSDAGRDLADLRAGLEWAFAQEGDPETSTALAAAAVARLLDMGLLAECREWSQRALAVLPPEARDGRRELELSAALGLSWMYTLGNGDDVQAAFARGLDLAESLDDADYQLRLLSGLHTYLTRRADIRGALAAARRADLVARRLGTPQVLAMTQAMQALPLHLLAEHCEAEALYDVARQAQGVSPRDEMARFGFPHRMTCLVGWARALTLSGRPGAGRRHLMAALEEAEAIGHPVALCITSIWGLPILIWTGDWQAAEAVARRCVAVAEQHLLAPHIAAGRGLLGEILVRRGDTEDGVALLQGSLTALEVERHALLKTPFSIALALGLSRLGRHDQALSTILEARPGMEARGDLMHLPDLLRIQGEILCAPPGADPAAVEALLVDSLACATDHKVLTFRLKAAISLARLRLDQGRAAEIGGLLVPLIEAFHDGEDLDDLRQARALIEAAAALH